MHISNIYPLASSQLQHIADLDNRECCHTLLAEDLHQLTQVEGLPNCILIQGDVRICASNINSFILLKCKEVQIEGSLIGDPVSISNFLKENKCDSHQEGFCFLPQNLHVKGNVNFSELSASFSLPNLLEIEGDLILCECKALSTLSKTLKVKGHLNLEECKNLIHLPENLEVGGNLDLCGCTALTSIPKGLKVKGSFGIACCENLINLPEDLDVGANIDCSGCTALTSIFKGLKVKGNFDLNWCENLIDLPEDLEIGGDFDFISCSLASLPKGLKIKGNLDLSYSSIRYLPEDLDVGGNIDLSSSHIEKLSKGFRVKGDLNLSHCTALLSPAEDLEVGGDLIFSDYSADYNIHSCFPRPVKIKGNLIMENIGPLIEIPEDLKIGGDIRIGNSKMKKFPKGLKLRGSLIFSDSDLECLPEDLTIEGDLKIESCERLISLPRGLKVNGNLVLDYCENFTQIPEDVEVGNDVNILDCRNFTSLSPGFKVNTVLDLSGCTALTHLPEDLEVEEALDLSGCTALTLLPNSLKLRGSLILNNCTNLTSLPNWITTLRPYSNEDSCIIDLTGCRFSPTIIERLQADMQNVAGTVIYFPSAEDEKLNPETTTLLEIFCFWQKLAKQHILIDMKEVCHKMTQILIQVQDQQNLLHFLIRLTKTTDYLNIATREDLAGRVCHILQLMAQDHELCQSMAFLIHQGLSSCNDRIIATLSDMTFYQKLQSVQQQSSIPEEIKNLGRGFFHLEALNKKIREYIKTVRFVDEVEVYMAFHIRLQKMLRLPLDTKSMFFRRCVSISDDEIDCIGREILQETTEQAFEAFLTEWDPWKLYQRRVSIVAWEQLSLCHRQLLSTDSCPYLQDTPEHPVLYNNVVYDYNAFIKRYIENGLDLFNTKIQIEKLLRIEPSLTFQAVSTVLDQEGDDSTTEKEMKKFKKE
ncbi:MAG: NEL-type E3 ubiquitin ligase domain-containing protein [Candidatus Rhabdochlamydia sp.]